MILNRTDHLHIGEKAKMTEIQCLTTAEQTLAELQRMVAVITALRGLLNFIHLSSPGLMTVHSTFPGT